MDSRARAHSEELFNRLVTLQRLAEWYYLESGNVSEHEARAYLVWPLLQVLGWSEQCVKFEWRARENKKLDLALMEKPFSEYNARARSHFARAKSGHVIARVSPS